VKNRLLVRNLPLSATPETLSELFERLGHAVQEIDCGPNEKWRLPRGYAVVTLANDADYWKAIRDTDGMDFDGRALVVDGVKPLKGRQRSERAA
jgi:RNA recognition motif-containing protein